MADVSLCCNCIDRAKQRFWNKIKAAAIFFKKEIAGGVISVPYFLLATAKKDVQIYKSRWERLKVRTAHWSEQNVISRHWQTRPLGNFLIGYDLSFSSSDWISMNALSRPSAAVSMRMYLVDWTYTPSLPPRLWPDWLLPSYFRLLHPW